MNVTELKQALEAVLEELDYDDEEFILIKKPENNDESLSIDIDKSGNPYIDILLIKDRDCNDDSHHHHRIDFDHFIENILEVAYCGGVEEQEEIAKAFEQLAARLICAAKTLRSPEE
jgi:hypothetical protein